MADNLDNIERISAGSHLNHLDCVLRLFPCGQLEPENHKVARSLHPAFASTRILGEVHGIEGQIGDDSRGDSAARCSRID